MTKKCLSSVAATCPESEQIHCGTSDSCTRIRYICDGDNDCGDYSDEESGICRVGVESLCGALSEGKLKQVGGYGKLKLK